MELADLAGQNNRVLRDLVRELRMKYKPASLQLICLLFKQVLDSPRDDNGVRLFKTEWNNNFIDLPGIVPTEQRAPMIPVDELNHVVANHRDGLLFATLAGTGARIGEILALRQSDWDREAGILTIRASKTAAGLREIDVPWALNDRMKSINVGQDRLFPGSLTSYRARARGVTGAFHSMRRFRLTHLRMSGMPEDLVMLAMGHANKTITDRYSRVRLNRDFRREWCERAGLGFVLTVVDGNHANALPSAPDDARELPAYAHNPC
jgi:hypothetical protein